nr:DUF151 domain-containing protein [Actinomyces faecalis]
MRLVAIRSTSPDEGLVALLVEEGGPSILAVPVSAREGLCLSAETASQVTWPPLLRRCLEVQGGTLDEVHLGVDDDAVLRAELVLRQTGSSPGTSRVPCAPADALMVSRISRVPLRASDDLLRLRGVDLGEESISQQVARWRQDLHAGSAEDW